MPITFFAPVGPVAEAFTQVLNAFVPVRVSSPDLTVAAQLLPSGLTIVQSSPLPDNSKPPFRTIETPAMPIAALRSVRLFFLSVLPVPE